MSCATPRCRAAAISPASRSPNCSSPTFARSRRRCEQGLTDTIEWRVEPGLLDYAKAVAVMEDRVAAIRAGNARELIWLVEHPPLYTAGTSADAADVLDARFPVHATGRGGRHTYHGPGQRVVYVMLDLNARGRDVRRFITALEAWVIDALAREGVAAFTDPARVGVWVHTDNHDAKIAAIGVRIRRWVTFHGVAINISPNLAHFDGIVPCGLAESAVTSLLALGQPSTMETIDAALHTELSRFIGRLTVTEMRNDA
ncbi:lipoyl(octanoyl) transferase LipB [Polymorphobacter sp. PAMC 29334]|nr:lipoyl(octanoyl) transferase LipB [Polymorphobacter sp. PAMC 29334]